MNVVVIPATYNEKGNIERLIAILQDEVFPLIKNHKMSIVVADDNSPDGTGDAVKALMKKYKNLDLNSGPKKGLGAAYIRAMSYAIEKHDAEVLLEMDADTQHDPHSIPAFLKEIDNGADIVIGTRYSQGGSMPENWPLQRKAFSVFGNLLVRTITFRFFIHDWTGGFRAIRKEVFLKEKEKVAPFQGYTFQVAFLYKSILDGFKVAEVPIHFKDRTLGRSKIAPLEYIINLLRYVITERINEMLFGKFGKFFAVGLFGLFINFATYNILSHVYTTLPLWIANTVGAELAIFSNYNLNNLWTFRKSQAKTIGAYFIKMIQFFLTSNIGVFIFQNGAIGLGEKLYGRDLKNVYFLIGTALLLVWNFTIYSKFIWKERPDSK